MPGRPGVGNRLAPLVERGGRKGGKGPKAHKGKRKGKNGAGGADAELQAERDRLFEANM